MLLVVAILMAMLGISWPLMQRAYSDLKVREAAENVRLKLASARIRAIDAGLTYQFRYEPNGRRFLLVPFEHAPLAPGQSRGNSGASEADAALPHETGEISDGLTFESEGGDSVVQSIDESLLAGLPNANRLADAGWSAPILFYSDGTATETKFHVIDEKRQFIEISLRELTGFVSVSPVQRETKR